MIDVFIIAAQTLDGFIAKDSNHPAFWTSQEDKKRFVELTKKAGVCIMGSSTFKTLPRPLKERVNIVYSRSQKEIEGAIVTAIPPVDLIKKLEDEGYKEIAICGGSQIYTMFLKAGVVDKIYLTIEPIIFGTGVSLFNEELNTQLKLVDQKTTESGTIMLEYKVLNKLV